MKICCVRFFSSCERCAKSRKTTHVAVQDIWKRWCLLFMAMSICIVALSCQHEAIRTERPSAVVADSVASADGVTIQYDVRGSGDVALVFVHCWCCDRTYWKDQADFFAGQYRVVTLDLAGHGESGSGRRDWSMEAYGQDVRAVADKLNLKKMVLIGHSMGGPVAIAAAQLMPGRVIGLVGVDVFQNLEETFAPEQVEAFLAPLRAHFRETTDGFVRSLFPPSTDSALVAWVVADMSSAPPEVGIRSMEAMFRFDQKAVLQDIGIPVRCINADMWPTDAESDRRVIPSFEVSIMKGRGHFLHMEDPATFNKLLSEAVLDLVKDKVTTK